MFWDRNFYPHVSMIIKDLENKGILKEGEYIINIDW
nr:MAG TPA: Ftsk gamma domain [Caudoviricetes sp.]